MNRLFPAGLIKDSVFSPCLQWRHTLTRIWDIERLFVQFICLNPSTADENTDDPTVRRCINFARSWGYGSMIMTNLFAYRTTLPNEMKAFLNPVGPLNDFYLHETAIKSALVIAAWGVHGSYHNRDNVVLKILEGSPINCLKITKLKLSIFS